MQVFTACGYTAESNTPEYVAHKIELFFGGKLFTKTIVLLQPVILLGYCRATAVALHTMPT